jgi:WD repeat-containing protein 81
MIDRLLSKLFICFYQGDGNNSVSASYVYQQHRKPLLGVSFIDTARLAASCDGAVHLWDPFVGTSVRQLDASSR